jgi:hypothetical protein
VGVLHDVVPYLTDLNPHYRGIAAFVCAGVIVVTWYGAEQLASRVSSNRRRVMVGPVMTRLSVAAFWSSTLALYVWWDK